MVVAHGMVANLHMLRENSSWLVCNHRNFFWFLDGKVSKFVVKDLPSSDIVDQDGAGDAFVGGTLTKI